jgi:hypothetical protein
MSKKIKAPPRRESDPPGPVAWGIEYFQRHPDDDPAQSVPGREFLARCPLAVRARLAAIATAVADAPPPQFSGGGMFEAMRDDLSGFHEVRVRHGKLLYRLFVILERAASGLDGPSVVVITGGVKAINAVFTPREYDEVRRLGEEYRRRSPRSLVVSITEGAS